MLNIMNLMIDFFENPEFVILTICVIWDLIWKGVALYKAGQRSQGGRFVCLFIFNTCGILPIIYLLVNKDK